MNTSNKPTTLRAKADAYDKLQNSSTEYDEAMEINANQVEEWRKKAEAYGKGQKMWGVYDRKGAFFCEGFNEDTAKARAMVRFFEDWDGSEAAWRQMRKNGYTCRKVRVCEEVEG